MTTHDPTTPEQKLTDWRDTMLSPRCLAFDWRAFAPLALAFVWWSWHTLFLCAASCILFWALERARITPDVLARLILAYFAGRLCPGVSRAHDRSFLDTGSR